MAEVIPNDVRQPYASLNHVPIGTPRTVAKVTPAMTVAVAFAIGKWLGAKRPLKAIAVAQNPPIANPRIKRLSNKISKVDAIAVMALANTIVADNARSK